MSVLSSHDDVAPDVVRLRHLFVNLYLVGTPERWVLVDAGLKGAADDIVGLARERFGGDARPEAIVLTHGHFDHVGALPGLFDHWDVPVYAHARELPHLTGAEDYPPPDPTVGKGAMALLSFAYPHGAIDLGRRVQPLPQDGLVPGLHGWRWLHTPGHTGGHVSLFRDDDRVLIAGDAFVTVQQESLYAVARQKDEVHGPPAYFTPDWVAARASVELLAGLEPQLAATGHGTPMTGAALADGLRHLVARFDEIAVPDRGRYVPEHQDDGG
jgi:glyoxylase-like metal-dependent hydrolase (beta-lactamase superfamily II)